MKPSREQMRAHHARITTLCAALRLLGKSEEVIGEALMATGTPLHLSWLGSDDEHQHPGIYPEWMCEWAPQARQDLELLAWQTVSIEEAKTQRLLVANPGLTSDPEFQRYLDTVAHAHALAFERIAFVAGCGRVAIPPVELKYAQANTYRWGDARCPYRIGSWLEDNDQ
ncbi:hypothetical protein [Rhodanobacter soli]